MTSSVRERVLRGLGAGALGPVITVFVQLATVPLFLHFWGTKLYGEWLILSAVPAYLGLSDIGFGSVCGSEMTMLVTRGERREALAVFQSAWALTTVVSGLMALATSACIWFLPLNRWLKFSAMQPPQTSWAMLLLVLYVLLGLQGPPMLGGYRCEGNFPTGMLWGNITRFADNAAMTLAVCLGATPVTTALALLLTRVGGQIAFYLVLRSKSPWIVFGFRHVTLDCLRRLFRPAVAYMAFPVGAAISLQGTIIVVGLVLGPVAVVVFTTLRTLTRSGFQAMDIIRNSIWAEISAAFGAQDELLARRLHRLACQATLWLCFAGMGALYLIGPRLYRVWTHGQVAMDVSTFHWLLLVIVANSFWYTSSVVMMATNTHARMAVVYLASTAASLALAYALLTQIGLKGAAIALLATDLLTAGYVFRNALAMVHDHLFEFLPAMLNFGPALALVRRTPRAAMSAAGQ